KGDYVIDQVDLEDAEDFLKVLPSGENNYVIFEKDTAAHKKAIAFQHERIKLNNVLLNYEDSKRDQEYVLFTDKATAKLTVEHNVFDIAVEGNMESRKIRVQEESFFRNKALKINAYLNYHLQNDSLDIRPSKLFVEGSEFSV